MKITLLFLMLLCPLMMNSQTITVTGSPWVVTLSYPFDEVMSADPQVQIDINPTTDWMVSVQRDAIGWQNDLHLSIRRTGNGTGNPQSIPQGGTSWIEITTAVHDFFWGGAKNRNNIPCQYLLESDWPEEGYFSTIVTFTITSL